MTDFYQNDQVVHTQYNAETININVENMSVQQIAQKVIDYIESSEEISISRNRYDNKAMSYQDLRSIANDYNQKAVRHYFDCEQHHRKIQEILDSDLPIELVTALTVILRIESNAKMLEAEVTKYNAVLALENYNRHCSPTQKVTASEMGFPEESSFELFEPLKQKMEHQTANNNLLDNLTEILRKMLAPTLLDL